MIVLIIFGVAFCLYAYCLYIGYKAKQYNLKYVETYGLYRVSEKLLDGITYYVVEHYNSVYNMWERVALCTDVTIALNLKNTRNAEYFEHINEENKIKQLEKISGKIL